MICQATGKTKHKSKGEANEQIRSLKTNGRVKNGGRELDSYLCDKCNHWHVGNRPDKSKKGYRLR